MEAKSTSVMQFRKKPVVIEAVQFTAELALAVLMKEQEAPFGGAVSVSGTWHGEDKRLYRATASVETLEGVMRADLGDWLIKGVKGEVYPCKSDIFAATYEPAEMVQRSEDDIRAEFESWALVGPLATNLSRWHADKGDLEWPVSYVDYKVQAAWEAWLTATRAAERQR